MKIMTDEIAKLLLENLEISTEVFLQFQKAEIMEGEAATQLNKLINSNQKLIILAKEEL